MASQDDLREKKEKKHKSRILGYNFQLPAFARLIWKVGSIPILDSNMITLLEALMDLLGNIANFDSFQEPEEEEMDLNGRDIHFTLGCHYCQRTGLSGLQLLAHVMNDEHHIKGKKNKSFQSQRKRATMDYCTFLSQEREILIKNQFLQPVLANLLDFYFLAKHFLKMTSRYLSSLEHLEWQPSTVIAVGVIYLLGNIDSLVSRAKCVESVPEYSSLLLTHSMYDIGYVCENKVFDQLPSALNCAAFRFGFKKEYATTVERNIFSLPPPMPPINHFIGTKLVTNSSASNVQNGHSGFPNITPFTTLPPLRMMLPPSSPQLMYAPYPQEHPMMRVQPSGHPSAMLPSVNMPRHITPQHQRQCQQQQPQNLQQQQQQLLQQHQQMQQQQMQQQQMQQQQLQQQQLQQQKMQQQHQQQLQQQQLQQHQVQQHQVQQQKLHQNQQQQPQAPVSAPIVIPTGYNVPTVFNSPVLPPLNLVGTAENPVFSTYLKQFLEEPNLDSLIEIGKWLTQFETTSVIPSELACALKEIAPDVKVSCFGAKVSGVGYEEDFINLFVDDAKKEKSADSVKALFEGLMNFFSENCEDWIIQNTHDAGVRTLLTVKNHCEGVCCRISFASELYCANTKLIQYYMHTFPVCQRLCYYVQEFTNLVDLNFSRYLIVELVVFFLQMQDFLPTVAQLQTGLVVELMSAGWLINFSPKSPAVLKLKECDSDLRRCAAEFFQFYGRKFNFAETVVCPQIGMPVNRSDFHPDNEWRMPLKPYKAYLEANKDSCARLDTSTPMCVQDLLELTTNVGAPIGANDRDKFVRICQMAFEFYTNNQ